MDKKEIEFEFERATKNTYRFQEKSTGFPFDRHTVRPKIGVRFKGTKESESYGGVGVKLQGLGRS